MRCLGRDACIGGAVRRLPGSGFCKELAYGPIRTLVLEVSTFITYLRGQSLVDNGAFSFLHPSAHSRAPVFCMLPGVHRQNTPGRPIV